MSLLTAWMITLTAGNCSLATELQEDDLEEV